MASDSKSISSSKPKLKIDSSKKKSVEVPSSIKPSVSADPRHRSAITSTSKLIKKTSKSGSKTAPKTHVKKVYSLAGQKFDVPEEREPLRIFYESLSKQIPSSEMAEFWLMEHGLLPPERAKKAHEKKQRKQKQLRMGTPIKSPPTCVSTKPAPSNKGESSQKMQQVSKSNDVNKAKKRIKNDTDEDDDDFVLSHKRRKC